MDMSKVIIKNLDRENLNDIRTFLDDIYNNEKLKIRIPEHVVDNINTQDEMRADMFLAYLEDEIIGYAGCMKNRLDSKNVFIQGVIHPNYRQQGLGCKLYDMILDRAKKNDTKEVVTIAKESMSQSTKFLQNRGFEIDSYMWEMDLDIKDTDYKKIPAEKCNIRVVTIEDNNDYVDIMNSGFKKEGEELYNENSFIMMFKKDNKYVFFIEQNSRIVATAAINIEKDRNRGYITNLTVYKDFRGKGFGEITINHCINVIKEAGLQKVALGVSEKNGNALNLYKKLGFVRKSTDIIFKKCI